MVAYSFKAQFREPILAGTKRQTIRADRKRHARLGEALQLYTGMRTRQCKLIGRATCNALGFVRKYPNRVACACSACGFPLLEGFVIRFG